MHTFIKNKNLNQDLWSISVKHPMEFSWRNPKQKYKGKWLPQKCNKYMFFLTWKRIKMTTEKWCGASGRQWKPVFFQLDCLERLSLGQQNLAFHRDMGLRQGHQAPLWNVLCCPKSNLKIILSSNLCFLKNDYCK